jgi:3-hydroxyacyl-CoA dehydrogenase, NAD binding domain
VYGYALLQVYTQITLYILLLYSICWHVRVSSDVAALVEIVSICASVKCVISSSSFVAVAACYIGLCILAADWHVSLMYVLLLLYISSYNTTNSPAQAMPLVECVRGAESSPNTIATVLAATRKLGKVSSSFSTTFITAAAVV